MKCTHQNQFRRFLPTGSSLKKGEPLFSAVTNSHSKDGARPPFDLLNYIHHTTARLKRREQQARSDCKGPVALSFFLHYGAWITPRCPSRAWAAPVTGCGNRSELSVSALEPQVSGPPSPEQLSSPFAVARNDGLVSALVFCFHPGLVFVCRVGEDDTEQRWSSDPTYSAYSLDVRERPYTLKRSAL